VYRVAAHQETETFVNKKSEQDTARKRMPWSILNEFARAITHYLSFFIRFLEICSSFNYMLHV